MAAIGFIGSGHQGGTVARLAVGAGYEVVLSNSRGPQTLDDLVEAVGPHGRAATPTEAAAAGDLVVVSIPPEAYPAVPVRPLAGKPVLGTVNYIPQRDGRIPEPDDGSLSSSEVLQWHLGTARVVKVFNNITSLHLASLTRPAGAADRSARADRRRRPGREGSRDKRPRRDRLRRNRRRDPRLRWSPLPVRYPRVRLTVRWVERREGVPSPGRWRYAPLSACDG